MPARFEQRLTLPHSFGPRWTALLLIAVACGQGASPDAPVYGQGQQNLNPGVASPVGWFPLATTTRSSDARGHSSPEEFTQVGSTLFFSATHQFTGRELWKTDGTSEGTVLVKDINVVPGSMHSNPTRLTAAGGLLYFTADDGVTGRELWRSDGTPEGTILLKDIAPGQATSNPDRLIAVNGTLFFLATQPATGTELWSTDGTRANTKLVKDIAPGAASSGVANLTAVGSRLYFTATAPDSGQELWAVDTSDLSASMVKDINPGASGSALSLLTNLKGTLYFKVAHPTSGDQLWKSNGTSDGTALVYAAGTGGKTIHQVSALSSSLGGGDILIFTVLTGSASVDLWKLNGDDDSTTSLKTIALAASSPLPDFKLVAKNRLFFTVSEVTSGNELWWTNGTSSGTRMLSDIEPGTASSSPAALTLSNGDVYFTASTSASGRELWAVTSISLFTSPTVKQVADVTPGSAGTTISQLTDVDGKLHFVARGSVWWTDGVSTYTPGKVTDAADQLTAFNGALLYSTNAELQGIEPWIWAGSNRKLLRNINTYLASDTPGNMAEMNGILYFAGGNGISDRELWRTDGTSAGTFRVKDINQRIDIPTTEGSLPAGLTEMNGILYFTAFESVNGRELWRSDGTEAGTFLVKDINPGPIGGALSSIVKYNGILYLFASDGATSGQELWKSDGTAAGTVQVSRLAESGASSSGDWLINANGTLFFTASGKLWKSDGTTEGTVPVSSSPVGISDLTDVNGKLFFTHYSDAREQLWKSDGTAAGTVLVRAFEPGLANSRPRALLNVNGTLYFIAGTAAEGLELWKSDGTTAGTVLVKDIYPGASSSTPASLAQFGYLAIPTALTQFGNLVVFAANDGVNGVQLWESDGTESGTRIRSLIAPGGMSSWPSSVTAIGDALLFGAADTGTGTELWKSTAAGTARLHDIHLGARPSFPSGFKRVGDRVFFTALADFDGFELYVMPATAVDTPPTITCPDSLIVEATSPEGAVAPLTATATDLESVVTPSFDPPVGTTLPVGTHTVIARTKDGLGTIATCEIAVTVQDTHPPTVSCPSDVAVLAPTSAGREVSFDAASASDVVTPSPAITYSKETGSTFPIGQTIVTATATDGAGLTASCTFTVTVTLDDSPPVLTCPPDVFAEASSTSGATALYAPASATDGFTTAPTIQYSQASGTVFPLGTTPVTVTARDDMSNTSTCTFTVTVQDTIAPVLACPGDVAVEAVSPEGAMATFLSATASDGVTQSPTIGYSHASGSIFALGETTVLVTARDGSNNTSQCSFRVSVHDTSAPVLSCPANVLAEATSLDGAVVSYGADIAVDAVTSSVPVEFSIASGTTFPLGDTLVQAKARDDAGNSSSCEFTVSIRDTLAPALTCPADLAVEATSPQGALVSYSNAAAIDATTPEITYAEASGGLFSLGLHAVTVTATDLANNAATCTFNVDVRDTTPPVIVPVADLTVEATYAGGAMVTLPTPVVSDAVSQPLVTLTPSTGQAFPLGTTTVLIRATDAALNSATSTFAVTVVDTTAPQITCPDSVAASTESDDGTTVTFNPPHAADTVMDSPTVTLDYSNGSHFPVGETTVTAVATDDAGNTATCQFKVTVERASGHPDTLGGSAGGSLPAKGGCSSVETSAGALLLLALLALRRRHDFSKNG